MAQVAFNRELEIILVRLSVGGVNADESQVLPVGVDTGASTTVIPTQVALDLGYDLANPNRVMRIVTGSGMISIFIFRFLRFPMVKINRPRAIGKEHRILSVGDARKPASLWYRRDRLRSGDRKLQLRAN